LVFVGTVRRAIHPEFGALERLEYEAYESMAERVLADIVARTEKQYGVKIAVRHRLGSVGLGEASLWLVVGSPHRDEAYRASRQVLEAIKHTVPIWKKEIWLRGETWSEGCSVEPLTTDGGSA